MKRDKPDYMLKILAKRLHKEEDKWLMLYTSGYGGRPVFIPKSQILIKDLDDSDGYIRIKITSFIFGKIKDDLMTMREDELIVKESAI